MKPYIFLSENHLKYTQDSTLAEANIRDIEQLVPYTAEVYLTDLYGNIVARDIDTLILQDTNIVNMTVEAADNMGNFSQLFTLQGNDQSTVILKNPAPVTTSLLRITIEDDTYNPEQVVGKLGMYSFLDNLFALTDSSYKTEANEGSYRVVSGAYIHWADYKKWVAKVKMENVTSEQFKLLTEQADKGEMTVIPYTDVEAEAIYECAVKREYSYELDRKTGLFNLDLEFNEL